MIRTHARNASIADLKGLLEEQVVRRLDVVAPAQKIKSVGGVIQISDAEDLLSEEGVTKVDGLYRPTAVFDEGIADKLGIPVSYVRRLRNERPDLYDANVNGWLHGKKPVIEVQFSEMGEIAHSEKVAGVPADSRSFLVRCFRGDDGEEGLARAFLSDKYSVIDNLDFLVAALDGVRQAGADVQIDGCDLTDRRMYVRVVAPQVRVFAWNLLKGYRSPFSGQSGADCPDVFAGFVLSNSEVGNGAWTVTPRMVIEVCNNGLTVTKDALRGVHLGSRMDDGVIRWSEDTQRKQLGLVTARARDAVATFLDTDYMSEVIADLEEKAEMPLEKPQDDVTRICKRLQFDQETIDGVFSHFVKGGQGTAGGLMAAVTSYAQVIDDADTAFAVESSAMKVLEIAKG